MTISTDTSFKVKLDNVWLDDDSIAEWISYIAKNATKSISTKDDWIVSVPDYWVRLEALKLIMKTKWLLKEEKLKSKIPEWIYVLVN